MMMMMMMMVVVVVMVVAAAVVEMIHEAQFFALCAYSSNKAYCYFSFTPGCKSFKLLVFLLQKEQKNSRMGNFVYE